MRFFPAPARTNGAVKERLLLLGLACTKRQPYATSWSGSDRDFALVAYGFASVVAREAARRARSTAMTTAIATRAIVASNP